MRNKSHLDTAKIVKAFQKSESSTAHHKGTFKINAPFEKALETVLKSKPNHTATPSHKK